MAVCKSNWLYFNDSELPKWATEGEFARFYHKGDDWVLSFAENPGSGKEYQKWGKGRIRAPQMKSGTYFVLPHSPFAIFLRYESDNTERKSDEEEPKNPFTPPNEPEFDPATSTAKDARQWLIWREFWLLKGGKVPQGWASVADAFLDRIKERDLVKKREEEKKALTNGDGKKLQPKSERELLVEIITSPTTNPRDKMNAQIRLNELDAAESQKESTAERKRFIVDTDETVTG